MVKTLKIGDATHTRLQKHGSMGDSFDDVINRILDYYEKTHKGRTSD